MNILRKISQWYFTSNALPYWCVLLVDCLCVYVPGIVCYYMENGGIEVTNNFWPLQYGMLLSLLIYVACFKLFHTYTEILRFSSFTDLMRTVSAMALASVLVYAAHKTEVWLGLSDEFIIPEFRTICTIFIVSTMLMWGVRIVVKNIYDVYHHSNGTHSVFIYGAMEGGVALAKSVRNTPNSKYKLAGIVSTDPHIAKSWMLGIKVSLDTDELPQQMLKKGADVLLVSPLQTEYFRTRSTLIDALIKANIKIMIMPEAQELKDKSDITHMRLREVDIEDLLPREKIEVDMDAIASMLCGKRVLITGAAGSIGSEISRQVAKFGPSRLILIDQAETPMHDLRIYMSRNHASLQCETIVSSITDQQHMEKIFDEHRPEYVFHAAAYKHVPMMEDNPGQAIRNNVFGTRVVADLAVKYGTRKFVMISTDKAVNPTNVMGCSKRICEIYCQSLNNHQQTTQFVTTRFGNVLGSNGSVIPIFREQIKKGGPVTVTHPDIIRYFMLIPEACRLVLEAGTMGRGGEIFVFDMGEPVRIVDLARRMIALSGAKDVEIKFSGLRDGEKLYEELLATKENTKATTHPKIMVATVREYPYELALKNEQELYDLSCGFDSMAIVRKMKEIVPEFKSQNSKYQELD